MHRTRFWLAGLAVLLAASVADAQAPPMVKQVRIGLPISGKSGDESGRSRNGLWTPVVVTLEASSSGHPLGAYRLRIETTDMEEQAYQYTVPVPAMAANSVRTVQGYMVPGSESAIFKVHLDTADGRPISVRDKLTRDNTKDEIVPEQDILFLAAGPGLSAPKRVAEKLDKPDPKNAGEDGPRARRQFVFAEDVAVLPDRWWGYDAVDVVVLGTGKAEFVNQLEQDNDRRKALLEWVRRGGQLILSVGRNQQEVARLLNPAKDGKGTARLPLIDCEVLGSKPVAALPALSLFCDIPVHKEALRKIEVAALRPGPEVHVIVRETTGPLIVVGSCGLGRTILVGFDLDAGEFAAWGGQEAFWARLQAEVAPTLPARAAVPGQPMPPRRPGRGQPGMPPGMGGFGDAEPDEVRNLLKQGMETFGGTQPMNVGWVLLFLLLYIALVGPLDYFLLKKVFKRLELTWITFPITVIVVSVAAYFTAYAMKGSDLRINKIDLVDIDMHQPRQAYGRVWFTLFSPRAQSYTVGVEPAEGSWTAPLPAGAGGPVVTLLEGGDNTRRQASQPLFHKPYQYADEASGMLYVPVPVWSTRSFTASWSAPLLDKPPIGIEDGFGALRVARDGGALVGRLTNNLPVQLKGVCLFHNNRWYSLGDLAPGEETRVEQRFAQNAQGQGRDLSEWFAGQALIPGDPVAPSGRLISDDFRKQNLSAYYWMQRLMFFNRAGQPGSNAGLRTLDQSWRTREQPQYPPPERARYRDEVILVARAPMLHDFAETVSEHGASASRVWMGRLPAAGESRPAIAGVMTQETYVRVFIPVQRR